MRQLEGRTALITGAASGIGAETAKLFVEEGAQVIGVDRPGVTFTYSSPGFTPLEYDITTDGAPADIMAYAGRLTGGLDILLNNAGVVGWGRIEDTDDALLDRVLAVNLRAVFRLSRAAIPLLRCSSNPRLINVASSCAERAEPGLSAYSASKAAVTGMTRVLAIELGRDGITVNAILPGTIRTAMTADAFADPDYAAVWEKRCALGRLGEAIDVARVGLFFASSNSGFVTGQSLFVDGGISIRQ